ncbi:hypothetical protein [Ramlibacter albus]|uniref:DUF2946 domain-containing protein n=1 Tax=Ramlibacter albus TaxID=2079448 RepID=A0A923S3H9_9BURK|nr:hypothetical protein [Ramlibacter albus]MBC5766460.1 hypothetical protein [Ramlibacter albus]
MPAVLIFVNKHAFRALVAGVFLTAGSAAWAEAHEWRCWYNAPEHVSCMPKSPAARASWPNRFMHIPLHTIPFDANGLSVLAQAVVCGRRGDCAVQFSREMPVAAEHDDLTDPLLAASD